MIHVHFRQSVTACACLTICDSDEVPQDVDATDASLAESARCASLTISLTAGQIY